MRQLTRDEFIAYWHQNVPVENRTPDGVVYPDRGIRRFAKACDCGDSRCQGWIMEYDDDYSERFHLAKHLAGVQLP